MDDEIKINSGLRGVYFERSSISSIDGTKGELYYRGYSIDDLAKYSTFEEVAYMLIFGEMPNQNDLIEFQNKLKKHRTIPKEIHKIIENLKDGHPMDVLRTSVSALASLDQSSQSFSESAFIENGLKLTSQIPTIIASHNSIRNGNKPVDPNPDFTHASNWLWMLKGEKPSQEASKLADIDFILHAEHGSNASSFAARTTIGTNANLHAAFVTAISTLAGPAHGGAAEDVMKMLQDIGTPENVKTYILEKRKKREPITGFGHRVYKVEDPRAKHMKEGVKKVSIEMGEPKWFNILEALVKEMKPFSRHGLNVNVDFYSGALYKLHNIPPDLFVPIFAIGRVPGWIIQCIEQLRNNILIRPLTLYNGPKPRKYIPISQRK